MMQVLLATGITEAAMLSLVGCIAPSMIPYKVLVTNSKPGLVFDLFVMLSICQLVTKC